MKLSEKLLSLRKANGLTQVKLAELMNVSRQAISRWEVGESASSTKNLEFLGRLYDVPLEYLLHADAPEPVPQTPAQAAAPSGAGKKQHSRFLIPATALLAAAVILLFSAFLKEEPRQPVAMEKPDAIPIEGLDITDAEISSMDEFEIEMLD